MGYAKCKKCGSRWKTKKILSEKGWCLACMKEWIDENEIKESHSIFKTMKERLGL